VNHKEKKASTEAKLIARLKLAPINAWVGSWAMFWYLSFQLPFALISTVGFGIAFSVYNYIANLPAGQVLLELGLDAIKLVGEGASTAGQVIQFVSDALFGIPFDPISLFILPFALILILSLLQLIIIWSIYSLAGIKSLTGEKAAIKNMMFLIAGIGGVIPILNIFPLIFLWILIVWKYPK
jgi:hypothetical protein